MAKRKRVKVGSITKAVPKGCLGFINKAGKPFCVPMKWSKVRNRRRKALGGGLTEKKKKGYLYFIKGKSIYRVKMKRGGGRRRKMRRRR